jgi:hypothetical protein
MKTKIRGQEISGYYGPDMGKGRWLFVRSKKTGRTYSVARVVGGQIVELDDEQALTGYTNQEIAEALIAAG